MAGSLPRAVALTALVVACVALVPVADHQLGDNPGLLSSAVTAIVLADLLVSALLFGQFLARGSSQILGMAGAFLFAGLLGIAYALALPGTLTPNGVLGRDANAPGWLWALWHAGLPVALALALWGGPPELRRALANPAAPRHRVVGVGAAAVSAFVGVCVWLLYGLDDVLPALTGDDGPTTLARAGAPFVVAADLAAVLALARRGRRTSLERRLVLVAVAATAATTLGFLGGQRMTVGWYAAAVLELLATAIVVATLLSDTRRLGGRYVRGDGAIDELTGVLSRGAAIAAIERLHSERRPGVPLAIALLDVDRLREIGDRYGAMAADAVMLTVARRLVHCLRDEDILGRASEDGFLLALPATDAEGATLALDRAIAMIRDQPVGTWAHDVRTTASAGLAMVGQGDTAVADALAAADQALNEAKANGRDQVVSAVRATVVPLRRAGSSPQRQ